MWRLALIAAVATAGTAAIGAPDDKADTRTRLERLYREHQIDDGTARGEGCGVGKRTPDKPKPPSVTPSLPAWLGYGLIGLVVGALVVLLILALRGSYREVKGVPEESVQADEAAEATASAAWLVDLAACRALFAAGRLAEAFAALHRLALLQLEQRGLLRLDETTTNWDYVRQLASRPGLGRVLADLTEAAERSVLGARPPLGERYGALEGQLVQVLAQTEGH